MSEAWGFISRKKLTASPAFAMEQKFKEKVEIPLLGRRQLAERAIAAARKMRFKARVTEADDRTTIFAERGVWNRLRRIRRTHRAVDDLRRLFPDQPRSHREYADQAGSIVRPLGQERFQC